MKGLFRRAFELFRCARCLSARFKPDPDKNHAETPLLPPETALSPEKVSAPETVSPPETALPLEKRPVLWSVVSPRVSSLEERRLRALSLWWDTVPGELFAREPLRSDIDVDIAIVGAGFTGLWTAYYLLRAAPDLRLAVLEKEVAGFGASGRNGGWCSALSPYPMGAWRPVSVSPPPGLCDGPCTRPWTRWESGRRPRALNVRSSKAGPWSLLVLRPRSTGPMTRWRSPEPWASTRKTCGGYRQARLRKRWVTDILGATFTPHCAALDPARLVRGLAGVVERLGGAIYEGSEVYAVHPGGTSRPALLRTRGASVRAEVVVRAVEAWTPTLPEQRRALLPIYSLMIATEPLPDVLVRGRPGPPETFSDHRRLIIYGQRTADGRLAFGGRGAPYHLGSAVRPSYDRAPRVHRALRDTLVDLYPALGDATVTHAWGRAFGRTSRLVRLGGVRPQHKVGVGRRLRRRRRVYQQPGRADAGGPGAR